MKHALPLLAALLLAACGVEQSAPAPANDAENWGHLDSPEAQPQQAEAKAPGAA